jgi:hypothetical protein
MEGCVVNVRFQAPHEEIKNGTKYPFQMLVATYKSKRHRNSTYPNLKVSHYDKILIRGGGLEEKSFRNR